MKASASKTDVPFAGGITLQNQWWIDVNNLHNSVVSMVSEVSCRELASIQHTLRSLTKFLLRALRSTGQLEARPWGFCGLPGSVKLHLKTALYRVLFQFVYFKYNIQPDQEEPGQANEYPSVQSWLLTEIQVRYQTLGHKSDYTLTVISCSQMVEASVDSSEHWVGRTGRPLLPSTIVQSQSFEVVILLAIILPCCYYVKKVKPNLEDLLIYEFTHR